VRGNPYEAHVNQLYPPAFHELGYKTKTLGEIDTIDSNVLAYKRLRHRRSRRRIDDFSKWMEDLSKVNVG